MRIFLRLAVLSSIFLLAGCSASQLFNNDLSLNRESPSYVVKKFWRLAQENDFEEARQLVSKNGIDTETEDGRQDEFHTPEFIKMMRNADSQMQSICECEADTVTFANVLLKVEKKEGNTEVFKFILSDRNAKKIWKIVWVSQVESSNSECSQFTK